MALDLHRRTVLCMEISLFTCGGSQIHLKPAIVASKVFFFVRMPNNTKHMNNNRFSYIGVMLCKSQNKLKQ